MAKKSKDAVEYVWLQCTECDDLNYRTPVNVKGGMPEKLKATAPAMRTPWSSSGQATWMSPPSSDSVATRSISPRRTALTNTAQDDEPEARVMPVPRSQTRMRNRSGPISEAT